MKTISVFSIVVLALTLLLFSMTGTAVAVCGSDADCDDGVFCNGEEHCASGNCVTGTPPDCDDGIACTTDNCGESIRACWHGGRDLDSDGHGDASCGGDDCDDTDGGRYPGNVEVCDSGDEDCDPATFGNRDRDFDGFVDSLCCNGSNCGDDCDDMERSIHPIQNEVCNGRDDDCDGSVDLDSAGGGLLTTLQFLDLDGDGYGDPSQSASLCPGTPGYSMLGNDCNDSNPAIVPGTMVCHPTDQTKLKICMNDGMFTEASCPSQPKTNCVTQPNGTGLCQTKKP